MSGYNFTERMRKVLAMACEQAVELGYDCVSTEHILLAIIAEGEGNGATVMRALDGDLEAIARRVKELANPERRRGWRSGPDLPYTSAGKRVLELAMREARELNHSYVGTEHLLLGLLGEGKGVAARALGEIGIELSAARAETEQLVMAQMSTSEPSRRGIWLDRLAARRIDGVELSVRFHDGEVRQRSFASAREAAEYLWRGAVS